jgi:hypothetical protein
MVKLDRVEMIRADSESAALSKEEENTLPLAIQKQKKSSAVKDKLLSLRDEKEDDPVESREDIPAVCENRYGMRDNEEEIIIEAEFETVLEEDTILMARDTAIEEEEVQHEDKEKSDPILMTRTTPRNEQQQQQESSSTAPNQIKSLISVDEETELEEELGGIEVEYGLSLIARVMMRNDSTMKNWTQSSSLHLSTIMNMLIVYRQIPNHLLWKANALIMIQ